MIEWKIEQLIRDKYQRGELEGQIPDRWNEDEVVDYFATYGVPYLMSKGKVKDEVPEWATRLARTLDQVEKLILPAIERMNREKQERARQEERFYRSLETDEERNLRSKRTVYPEPKKYPLEPEKYPEPEKEPYAEGEEAKADSMPGNQEDDLERATRENLKNPKIRHQDDEDKEPEPEVESEEEQPFHDYTGDNMTTGPKGTSRKPKGPTAVELGRTVFQGLSEAQRKDLVREFMKRKYHGGNEDE
jgi:hypothetical protein